MPSVHHPQQELIFVVLDGKRPEVDDHLASLLTELRPARNWTLGPPELIELEDEDRPGGALKLYSARPPWGAQLERELDVAQLEEVTLLVEKLARFSAAHGLEVEFELDGESVGALDKGRLSNDLAEGFLGEWRRMLEPQRG